MERPIYGLMAEFHDPTSILEAAEAAHAKGYRKMDAYTPFAVHGLAEAIGFTKTRVPLITLLGGIAGGVGGFLMQYWVNTMAYPLNIGGRPLNSWPSFIPVSFECTILLAALAAVFGMLALNGLPMPHHPVFNVRRFALASRDRYFLCIESRDPKFDAPETAKFLWTLEPTHVAEVADS